MSVADLSYRCFRDVFVDDSLALEFITVCVVGWEYRAEEYVGSDRHEVGLVAIHDFVTATRKCGPGQQQSRPNTMSNSSFGTPTSRC